MATHAFHDPDGGIGFDMRNAHLYHDSDDEDEIDERHRPKQYTPKDESSCNCCYVVLIIIILVVGSIIGYSLGSTFSAPHPYQALTNAPKPTTDTFISNTPSPHIHKDPFHNHKKGQQGGIASIFASDNTPKPTPKPVQSINTVDKKPFEPSAVRQKAFEPSAATQKAFEPSAAKQKPFEPSAAKQKPFEPSAAKQKAFEPSAAKQKAFEPSAAKQKPFEPSAAKQKAFEPSAAKSPDHVFEPSAAKSQAVPSPQLVQNDVDLHDIISHLDQKHKLKFTHSALQMDDEYDLGDSSILSKLVLDDVDVPHVFEHAQRFTIEYPSNGKPYDPNLYKTWCFHFYLFDYPSAQIDVTFHAFQMERGFDRVLIRHFNQSFLDPPVVYAGRGAFDHDKYPWIVPEALTYHLRRNEFKSICVELESDDSVGLSGIDFDVSIKYDDCEWSKYTECNIPNEAKKHWDRGPFYDGSCGIGVRQRQRTTKEQDQDAPPLNDVEGFVNCENKDKTDIDGPEYCLKAPCEHVDNSKQGIPDNIRYGWANHTTFYNGIGTLDAKYPDLLRILTASPSTPTAFNSANDVKQYFSSKTVYQSYPIYHIDPAGHKFDLKSIMNALENKKKEILSEHTDERVLTMPVLDLKHIDKSKQWLGARLSHSLLIGRPFTMIFTGSSNTAGHDNQFSSTYGMQLQARLRTLWTAIGVDGAALSVRNIAVGGAPKTDTMAWHTAARSSESVSYPYNTYNTDGLWRNEDVIVWESFMNDGGRPPAIASEEQLRLTASLNAIWAAMSSISDIPENKCNANQNWKSLRPKHHLTRDNLFQYFTDIYGEHMGLIEMDFETFVAAVCSEPKYKRLQINWHPNAGGHRCEADIYAYMLLSTTVDFMKTNQETIEKLRKDKNINALDEWLLEKSGKWGQKYIDSILKKDKTLFPKPKYCQPFCDSTIAPFALKTAEPNEWDVGYRLVDYIVHDYEKMNDKTTADDVIEGVALDLVPDIKSRFCVEQLLRSNGWNYEYHDHDPVHFPQDRTGKIGAMDRKQNVNIVKNIWNERFKEFLEKNHAEDLEQFGHINSRGKDAKEARKVYGKYVEEWSQYILHNDYDVKVAFLVPQIGNHSILAFTDEGGNSFYGRNGEKGGRIGIHLETMDRRNKVNKKYGNNYKYDFSQRLSAQRECKEYQRGCVFHDIAPGKYILRWYPMNMTKEDVPSLVQVIAF